MKHYLFILFWASVFALVWAAGHDILKGERDVWLEWTVVLVGLGLALVALALRIRKLKIGGHV
jgi:hypothetical protein